MFNVSALLLDNALKPVTPLTNGANFFGPPCRRTCFGSRGFFVAAPTIWNSLPLDIRNSCSINSFFPSPTQNFPFFNLWPSLVPRLTPSPQIQRVSRRRYCALYKFIYLLTYLLTCTANCVQCTYEIADDHLIAADDSQVKWSHLTGIMYTGVDVDTYRQKEQNSFQICLLNGHVQKVASLYVELQHMQMDWCFRQRLIALSWMLYSYLSSFIFFCRFYSKHNMNHSTSNLLTIYGTYHDTIAQQS